MECDSIIDDQRSDIVVVDKFKKEVRIIDTAIPGDACISDKNTRKDGKVQTTKRQNCNVRMWMMGRVSVIPAVSVGALTKFKKYFREMRIDMIAEETLKAALLGDS